MDAVHQLSPRSDPAPPLARQAYPRVSRVSIWHRKIGIRYCHPQVSTPIITLFGHGGPNDEDHEEQGLCLGTDFHGSDHFSRVRSGRVRVTRPGPI